MLPDIMPTLYAGRIADLVCFNGFDSYFLKIFNCSQIWYTYLKTFFLGHFLSVQQFACNSLKTTLLFIQLHTQNLKLLAFA